VLSRTCSLVQLIDSSLLERRRISTLFAQKENRCQVNIRVIKECFSFKVDFIRIKTNRFTYRF